MNYNIRQCLIFIMASLIIITCQKEIIVDKENNISSKLELKVEVKGNEKKFSWSKISISNFNKLVLVKSNFEISDDFSSLLNSSIQEEFFNSNITEYIDESIPMSEKTNYRLFYISGSKSVASNMVSIKNDVKVMTKRFSILMPIKNSQYFFASDDKLGGTLLFDFEKNVAISKSNEIFLNFFDNSNPNSNQVLKINNEDFIFSAINSNNTRFAKFSSRDLKMIIAYNDPLSSRILSSSVSNNFIFTSWENSEGGLKIFSSNMNLLKSLNRNTIGFEKYLYMVDASINRIAEFSRESIFLFTYKSETNSIVDQKVINMPELIDPYEDIISSPDNNFLLISKSGLIVDKNFNKHGNLNCTSCFKYIFSNDNKFIYKISSQFLNNRTQLIIDKHNLSDLKLISSKISSLSGSNGQVFTFNNEHYLHSVDFSTNTTIFINLNL